MVAGGSVAHDYVQGKLEPMVYVKEAYAKEHTEVEPKVVQIVVETNWTPEKIEQLIRDTFPEMPNTMVAVAKCESGLRPNAVGPTSDYGTLQIHAPTWHDTAINMGYENYRTDVAENIEFARHIYDVQGIEAWVCYTKGLYREHL